VQAQNQIDGLATAMAQALADETVAGTPAVSGLQTGFDVDISALLQGNTINLTYRDNQTNTVRNVTIVRVDDPDALPLADTATANPNDEVIGLDFSGGLGPVVGQLNTLFNGKLQFSAPSATTLQILDDGAGNLADVNAVSVTQTTTSLAGGGTMLPFFTDGNNPYSAVISASGLQATGFAGRISVNPALLGDPARLVLYGTGITAGDPTRPNFIFDQLTGASLTFPADTGLGTAATPFSGNLANYLQQVLSVQGQAAANAQNLAEGQAVVVNALQERVNEASGVNVDQEMANLITLQTAYGANARVMAAVKEMIDTLLRM
jgi:flagellar hook-associated protein 1 FlgK